MVAPRAAASRLARAPRGRAIALAALLALPRLAAGQTPAPVASAAPVESPRAAPLDERTRDEARRRFDRGLTLYNAGDLNGALAEFELAYRLTGHPLVLYNLALVQAALGQSVAALDAFSKLDSRKSEFSASQAARVQRGLEEQLLRVGTLRIELGVPGVTVQVDNVDLARTPTAPLRVNAGSHIVSLFATGYEPRHLRVTVAGGALQVVQTELVPLQTALAHLKVTSNVPDAAVLANSELIGHTPLASDVALKPGTYAVSLVRDGYLPARREIRLDADSVGQLDMPLSPSPSGLGAGGKLALALSEPHAIVRVDGEPRLDEARGLRLPLGRHTLSVERAGFLPVNRELSIKTGENRVDVALLPTPGFLADYVSRTQTQRTWSYIALGSGLLVTGSSAAFLIWNEGQKRDAKREFDAFQAQVQGSNSGTCPTNACADTLNILVDDLDEKRRRDVYGWVGVGIGAAMLGTGALLYALGGNPARYDPKPQSDVFGSVALKVSPRMLAISGAF